MTRIATLAASEHLLGVMSRTQTQVYDLQTQVSTGKRSQTYSGIADDARQLLNLEKQQQMLDRFEQNNTAMKARLDATSTTLDGISDTIKTLRQDLHSIIASTTPLEPQQAADVQQAAFRAMQTLHDYLNTDVDGRSLFAGNQVRTQPVSLPDTTLAAFQSRYDGETVVYPPTRAAQVGHSGALTHAATGDLSITQSVAAGPFDTITAATAGAFAQLEPGTTITITGSTTGNDGTYTVVSSDHDKQITIAGTMTFPPATTTITVTNALADPAGAPDTGATISIGNYYQGDTAAQTHRLDEDRSFSLQLNAIDPAFEKAMRALGILAQGTIGTSGGLDNHEERIEQALFLLNDAIERSPSTSGAPPFGSETTGSLEQVSMELGYQQVMLDESSTLHNHLSSLFKTRSDTLENADTTAAITKLLDGTQALEASYQVISRVRQLSLAKFL